MKRLWFATVIIFSTIVSCTKESNKSFEVIVNAIDTVNPGDLYSAKIYINRGDVKFNIEGFYFWDIKMHQDLDTGMLSFNADCSEYVLKAKGSSHLIKKNYKIFIKGNYNGKDTTIELTRSYFVNCGTEKSPVNIDILTEKDTLTIGESYNGKIFVKEKPENIKVYKWHFEGYELPRIGDTATIKFTTTPGNFDSSGVSEKYFTTWVTLIENNDTSTHRRKVYYYVK